MSDSSGDNTLRWVRYDDVYYAALVVPPVEAPVEVPDGHAFVFFLDGESGAVVPISDVAPYDPNDSEKATHPAAVAGVALANEILFGARNAAAAAEDGAAPSSSRPPTGSDTEKGRKPRRAAGAEGWDAIVSEYEDPDEDDERALLGLAADGGDGNGEDSDEKKKRRKKEKSKHKKEKKSSQGHHHRHRHDGEDGSEDGEGDGMSSDSDNDDDDENGAAKGEDGEDAVARAERRRRRKEEKRAKKKEERARRKKEKRAAAGKRSRSSDSESDAAAGHHADSGDDTDADDTTLTARRNAQGDNDWNDLEAEYDLASPTGNSHGRHGAAIATRRHGSKGDSLLATGGMSGAMSALALRSSPVTPYLAQIKYHYQQYWDDAVSRDEVVNILELDVVRAVEQRLINSEATAAYLETQLEKLERDEDGADDGKQHHRKRDRASREELERRMQALSTAIGEHRAPLDIQTIVQELVEVQPKLSADAAAAGAGADGERRRHRPMEYSRFHDQSTELFYRNATASAAVPRELTLDTARKYLDQRIKRERTLSYRNGLGKTGLFAAPKVLESWKRARELMVLAPTTENQPVMPAGFVARRHAETISKVADHALRQISAVGGPLLSSDDLTSRGNTQQSSTHTAARDDGLQASQLSFMSMSDLLSRYQTSTRRQRQLIPAYYSFHELRDDQAASRVSHTTAVGAAPVDLLSAFREDPSSMPLTGPDQQPLISPMHIDFDPRAAFALGSEELQEEQRRAEQLAARSMMYSTSIRLPSEESQWYSEMVHDGNTQGQSGHGRRRSHGGSALTSRATSAASSVAYSAYSEDRTGRGRRATSRGRSAGRADAMGSSAGAATGWRESAKRAILEQLTLYLRGLKGHAAVLDAQDFRAVARKLLDRALRTESERSGKSMAVQANNVAIPFTRETETKLKRSVDNYITRHYIASENGTAATSTRGSAVHNGGAPLDAPGVVPLPQPPMDGEAEREPVLAEAGAAADSPVYEN